jgi:hypothetical protein
MSAYSRFCMWFLYLYYRVKMINHCEKEKKKKKMMTMMMMKNNNNNNRKESTSTSPSLLPSSNCSRFCFKLLIFIHKSHSIYKNKNEFKPLLNTTKKKKKEKRKKKRKKQQQQNRNKKIHIEIEGFNDALVVESANVAVFIHSNGNLVESTI